MITANGRFLVVPLLHSVHDVSVCLAANEVSNSFSFLYSGTEIVIVY